MNFLKRNNSYPEGKRFGVDHVMVNLTPYIAFDSDGISRPLSLLAIVDKSKQVGTLSVEQLDVLWGNKRSWNTIFDRDCCDLIIKMLSELPAKYERFLKEGFIDIPNGNENVRLTDKTIKAIKEQQNPLTMLSRLLQESEEI